MIAAETGIPARSPIARAMDSHNSPAGTPGAMNRPRNVVARFPSLEKAVECYNSPAYQAALAHANGASTRDLMVVEEIE